MTYSQITGGRTEYPALSTFKQFETWVSKESRFEVVLSEKEKSEEVSKRTKLIQLLSLDPFKPNSEMELEAWADVAAAKVNSCLASEQVFKEAWVLVAGEDCKAVIARLPATLSHEDMVNRVALELFPKGQYVAEVEE